MCARGHAPGGVSTASGSDTSHFLPPPASSLRPPASRRAFTLIELLITVMIIGLMASMVLFAAFQAQETARVAKTRALVAKLDAIIRAKWDSYRTRRVPINIPPTANPRQAAQQRLDALRDLQRLELPDRWSDIVVISGGNCTMTPAATYTAMLPRPAVANAYVRRVAAAITAGPGPSGSFAGAECLYLIVTAALAEDGDGREVFQASDVDDVDGDGMPEFVDGWGQPIKFLRWPAGFQYSELNVIARGTGTGGGAVGTPVTVTAAGLSTTPGSYTGGAIIQMALPAAATANSPLQPERFEFTSPMPGTFEITAAHVIGYEAVTGTPVQGRFQIASTATPPTFDPNERLVVMAPDPFDPLRIYAVGTAFAAPSFAIYPLIYSSGADKCYGILADFDTDGAFDYSDRLSARPVNMNPFYFDEDRATGNCYMIGAARNDDGEPNYVESAWLDNIHNHSMANK